MKVDRKPFINCGDFHLPLNDEDILTIEAMRANSNVKQRFSLGEGMGDVLTDETVEQIVNSTVATGGNEGLAPFKFDTLAIAEEGKTISGDDLYEIVQEAKAKGVTVASLIHKLPNARTRVIVTPGPGVVDQAPRAGRKSSA